MIELNFEECLNFEPVIENGKIIAITVNNVNLPMMTEKLYPRVDPKNDLTNSNIYMHYSILSYDQKKLIASHMLITRYCIHRILTHLKIYQSENWTYCLASDYYGEEIDKIVLKPIISNKLDNHLEKLRLKNPTQKIEMILKMEHGHLIPSVANKKWNVSRIPRKNLYFSNQEHYNSCLEENHVDYFKELPYPRGIVVHNQKYRVIDGYRRILSTSDEDPLVIFCE